VSILNPSGAPPQVTAVRAFDARVADKPWPWAEDNAEEIARHWRQRVAERPGLFDGRVLIARELAIEGGVLESRHMVVPFSALLYWRDRAFPEAGACNVFGSAVVVSSDGAVLLGRMGAHTANAGQSYFPAGTPDLDDVQGKKLDIEGSILRELEEETGLRPDQVRPSGQRWLVRDGAIACCARRIDADLSARELADLTRAHLLRETEPELDGITLLHRQSNADPLTIPAYARALLGELLPR
jgi:8-oxo-dGTP pyrophosphatase MutT (NUDIX family)